MFDFDMKMNFSSFKYKDIDFIIESSDNFYYQINDITNNEFVALIRPRDNNDLNKKVEYILAIYLKSYTIN